MKVVELVGKDIMKAYDGKYLAYDFGYSCANFNVKNNIWGEEDNDEEMFNFYTLNPKNISCFVCYNDSGKIWGRRMFFKGKSLINDKYFDMPYKMGTEARYLYGYYGSHEDIPQRKIIHAVISKYGDGIIHTDKVALINRRPNYSMDNSFLLQVERADFNKYPPIDFLKIAPKVRGLSNFDPSDEFIEILEKDTGTKDVEFFHAYRYNPNKSGVNYKYTTWDQHKGIITDNDKTTIVQEEEDDDEINPKVYSLKVGDTLNLKNNGGKYTISKIIKDSIFIKVHGDEIELSMDEVELFFDL